MSEKCLICLLGTSSLLIVACIVLTLYLKHTIKKDMGNIINGR